jgi:hypothetical protein
MMNGNEYKFWTAEMAAEFYTLKANECADGADYYRNADVLTWLTPAQQRTRINRWQRLALEYAVKATENGAKL